MTGSLADGGRARITTVAGSAEATIEVSEAMLPGHAPLPIGFGVDYIDADGAVWLPGVAPNALTSMDWRDSYAGTPWHTHVPARIEAVPNFGGRHRLIRPMMDGVAATGTPTMRC